MAVKWSTPPPSLKILRLSVLQLWVLTSPVGYHWQCVCSHCACIVSRHLCVGANFSRIFEIYDPDLPIRYKTVMALQLRQMELFAKIVYGPVLKEHTYSSLRMCKIISALNAAGDLLPPSFSATIRFPDSDFFWGHDISAIWGQFLLIFALDKLNVRHISTFGLVDLQT